MAAVAIPVTITQPTTEHPGKPTNDKDNQQCHGVFSQVQTASRHGRIYPAIGQPNRAISAFSMVNSLSGYPPADGKTAYGTAVQAIWHNTPHVFRYFMAINAA